MTEEDLRPERTDLDPVSANKPGEPEEEKTAVDVLQDLLDLEDEAREALPYDPRECFHGKGSIKQLLYSCVTCAQATGKDVGVCYGCFVQCHTDHQVHELFYRRDFTCDCGTERSSVSCVFQRPEESRSASAANKYNHNFKGINCYCKLLHDDAKETREMIQCLVCEDWFHDSCIGEKPSFPADDFLCEVCLAHSDYSPLLQPYLASGFLAAPTADEARCTKPALASDARTAPERLCSNRGVYLPPAWRASICRCPDCRGAFERAGITFFLTPEIPTDPPTDSSPHETTLDAGLKALGRMERTAALDAVAQFAAMKTDLVAYLKTLSESGRAVSSRDIFGFFEVGVLVITQQTQERKRESRKRKQLAD
ncbi:hypothetical protein HDV03_002255 [Kappamyces sp. JEL0829]|nr:hypothetical protein HDV03_002255 [Kappamyces sp. JEL0829]